MVEKLWNKSDENMSQPITLVYLAYKFSYDATKSTKEAREMAIALMKKHPDWIVISPHYAVDVMLDGKMSWGKEDFELWNEDDWRRIQAGLMAAGFLSRADIMVLGCKPLYSESHGVTWEYIIANMLNYSYRKDNPIKIMTYEEVMK